MPSSPSDRVGARVRGHELLVKGGGLHVAERGGVAEGVLVLSDAPSYVPAAITHELYVLLLLTSRHRAGRGIGTRLIEHAIAAASRDGCRQLRVALADRVLRDQRD